MKRKNLVAERKVKKKEIVIKNPKIRKVYNKFKNKKNIHKI